MREKPTALNLRHFRYFVAAAEELHIGRAAQRLGIAQPALSQHVRALEDHLGVQLFLRAHRRIALTEAGEAFLAEARAALQHATRAAHAAQRAARGETGRVTIGYVSSALSEQPFVGSLAAYRLGYPDVTIEMLLRPASTLVQAVQEEMVDISVTRGPVPSALDGCATFVLTRQPLVAVLPDSHDMGARDDIALTDLVHDTLLLPDDPPGLSLGHTLRQLLSANGFSPQRTMVVNEMSSAIGLVAAGLGVALLPASARVMRLPGVAFCNLQGVPATTELLVVHRRFERSATVRTLLERLRLAREAQTKG